MYNNIYSKYSQLIHLSQQFIVTATDSLVVIIHSESTL